MLRELNFELDVDTPFRYLVTFLDELDGKGNACCPGIGTNRLCSEQKICTVGVGSVLRCVCRLLLSYGFCSECLGTATAHLLRCGTRRMLWPERRCCLRRGSCGKWRTSPSRRSSRALMCPWHPQRVVILSCIDIVVISRCVFAMTEVCMVMSAVAQAAPRTPLVPDPARWRWAPIDAASDAQQHSGLA